MTKGIREQIFVNYFIFIWMDTDWIYNHAGIVSCLGDLGHSTSSFKRWNKYKVNRHAWFKLFWVEQLSTNWTIELSVIWFPSAAQNHSFEGFFFFNQQQISSQYHLSIFFPTEPHMETKTYQNWHFRFFKLCFKMFVNKNLKYDFGMKQ